MQPSSPSTETPTAWAISTTSRLLRVHALLRRDAEHLRFTEHVWIGLGDHGGLVPLAWVGLACSLAAFALLLVPATRRRRATLNAGCALVWIGVYLEKGTLLVVGGMSPDTLGVVYAYTPSATELAVAAGVFGFGFLLFTVLVKIAVPILYGTFRAETPTPVEERTTLVA